MAAPRRIVPGTTYMLTRRCCQRTFRLKPSAETNQIFKYCIGLAAARTGVIIHAACVMSNHHHIVLTDALGRIPEFAREVHRLTAKAMNARQGQWENLWSAEHCHLLELADDDDVLEKIAYVAANPVTAGLVASPSEWPGVMSLPASTDGEASVEVVARPSVYFAARSTCPPSVQLTVAMPELAEVRERLAAMVKRKVTEARDEVLQSGWSFLGAARVMSASFVRRAKAFEVRRKIVPRVAAKSMFMRSKLLDAQREFRQAYAEAIELWRGGVREAVFPDGTWWMRIFHGVGCHRGLPAPA